MIVFKHRGNLNRSSHFLEGLKRIAIRAILDKYGREGVSALAEATPVDTGVTSRSWDYEIAVDSNGYSLSWTNSNVNNGVSIAILLQYGHGTGSGGYVQGRDYINPAVAPIIDQIAERIGKEVSRL